MQVNEAQYETFLINNGVGSDDNHIERINNLGKIERFNFSTHLSIWSNNYANMINGTDGTIWHPNARKDELIYTFSNDICRSVYLKFNQTRKNAFNINTYRYILPNDIYANSSNNEGFCLNYTMSNNVQQLKCLPSGLFSLSSCIARKFIIHRSRMMVRDSNTDVHVVLFYTSYSTSHFIYFKCSLFHTKRKEEKKNDVNINMRTFEKPLEHLIRIEIRSRIINST